MACNPCARPQDHRAQSHHRNRRHRRRRARRRAGRIAKTLAVRAGEHLFLLVARGNARLDNRKCKDEFGARPRMRMLGPEETFEVNGHPVGGVCPFGLKAPLPVYFDVSLRAFDRVYPAGGSRNTSVEVATQRLFDLVGDRWVDLCRLPEASGA
jgi:prolyl-tRNA editing enzyme YbaK/EbsC (Cys-tRNA(Pro) deacylase)